VSIDASSIRYVRQRTLAGFGVAGQESLAAARVLVIGAGGLGSAVLPILAAAGIGSVTVVDDDLVDESNLHRQTLYSPADVGRAKAEAAAEALSRLSPDATITARVVRFDAATATELTSNVGLIVDAGDNLATRYLANDTAAALGIPLVWGNALGWSGQAGVAWDARGADYRDLFPVQVDDDGANCATTGVLPSVCTVIGGLMAGETLKLLTASGDPLVGRVVHYDARSGRTREVSFRRPVGGRRPPSEAPSVVADTSAAAPRGTLSPQELKSLVDDGGPLVLLDVREPWEAEHTTIAGSVLIPLGELPARRGELDPAARTVVYCHHGVRSAQALELLQRSGFSDASHLAGGIAAWTRDIDPGLRRY
jgi:molybdopterin/thiamine biosynthesis adenylyltransferase/rhodanese-related sulfurtransferase